jgi:dipeptidyl aminopeptidase/acylaminoacyl peptidase
MERDMRDTDLWREIEKHFMRLYSPAFGKISGAAEVCASPDGAWVAFTGFTWDKLEGRPESRISLVEVADGRLEQVTAGPGEDRLPRWSPDGSYLAFLSDRVERGRHQLYLLEAGRLGEAKAARNVEGTVEYFWWSPDGTRILLGVAGSGADLAGAQGSSTTKAIPQDLPSWMPTVEAGVRQDAWRSVWVYDLVSGELQRASREGLNVWEAVWCGDDRVASIVSDNPGEESWYDAPLAMIHLTDDQERVLYKSRRQLGLPAASPSGARLAVVEAVCSDRWVVAGDMLLVDVETGAAAPIDTRSVDVTQ